MEDSEDEGIQDHDAEDSEDDEMITVEEGDDRMEAGSEGEVDFEDEEEMDVDTRLRFSERGGMLSDSISESAGVSEVATVSMLKSGSPQGSPRTLSTSPSTDHGLTDDARHNFMDFLSRSRPVKPTSVSTYGASASRLIGQILQLLPGCDGRFEPLRSREQVRQLYKSYTVLFDDFVANSHKNFQAPW